MSAPAIAIDFGTTRTKVAYFDHDQNEPRLIELGYEIRAIIPSVFYIPPQGQRLVGDDAQMMVDQDPEGIIIGLKKEIHRLGKIRCGTGRPSASRIELASDLFAHIRRKCEQEVFHGEDVTQCTLTIPVAFEEQKRNCIRQAAELGGFQQITLVEEPVAAARAWLARGGEKTRNHVAVCDVGGGTTDFALLRYDRGHFQAVPEVPTAGFGLGGNDVDESVLTHLLDTGCCDEKVVEKRRAGFLVKIRQGKELLTRQQQSEVSITLGGIMLKVPRVAVTQCAQEFIDRVTGSMKHFLGQCVAATGVKDIPILLVGGGSRLPGLKEAIEVLGPGRVYLWNQSDYATVLGAAEVTRRKVAKPSPATPTFNPLESYRDALRHSQSRKEDFSQEDLERLRLLAKQLHLSQDQAAASERDLLGMTKEERYARVQEACNTHAEAQGLLAEAKRLLERGSQLQNEGGDKSAEGRQVLDAALCHAQAACDLAPTWAAPFFLKGQVLHQREEWRLASAAFTVCLRLTPDDVDALAERAFCKLAVGDNAGARQDFTEVLGRNPATDFYLGRAAASEREADYAAAVEDLKASLTGTALAAIPRATINTILALFLLRRLNKPHEALPYLREALHLLPASPSLEEIIGFSNYCDWFRVQDQMIEIGLPNAPEVKVIHPIASAQHVLLQAAQLQAAQLMHTGFMHIGCTRQAVQFFNKHNGKHEVEWDRLWQDMPEFARHQASIFAEQDQAKKAIGWLQQLLAVQPACDFREVLRDSVLKGCPNPALRDFLTPKWSFTADHGTFFNHLTVCNLSPFAIHSVVVKVKVTRADGKISYLQTSQLDRLGKGDCHSWPGLFKDGGFFGGNIREIEGTMNCAEGIGRLVGATAAHTDLPSGSYLCPSCGFSSVREGTPCFRCTRICLGASTQLRGLTTGAPGKYPGNMASAWKTQVQEAQKSIDLERKVYTAAERQRKKLRQGKVGATITNRLGMAFAWVPAGTSWLGGGDGKPGTTRFELKQGLWCGVYPVTQADWQAITGQNPSNFKGNPRYPVEQVSWNDVQEFIKQLSQKTNADGLLYHLPTEEEWEYICRGGAITQDQSKYHFYFARSKTDLTPAPANDLSSTQANFDGRNPAGSAAKGPYLQRTCEVGLYLPNPLGIYDLHGNVWEWTSSLYEEGWDRVIRGGGWVSNGVLCAASRRRRSEPDYASNDFGFRLLAVPSGQ